ncbi:hypothetical protein ACHAWT_009853 [Skeletonema menzelii]
MRKSICTLLLAINGSKGFQFGYIIYGGKYLIKRQQLHSSRNPLFAKPKSGSVVDSYQTVSVNCSSCRHRLFRYKKKNGTKSNLIKCYVERIVHYQLSMFEELSANDHQWSCPNCGTKFARSALIHGRPALKLVGGKTRMSKK